MNNQDFTTADSAPRKPTIEYVRASLPRRYAAERRFRYAGVTAVILGMLFVVVLFVDIISKGYTAFQQTYIKLPVAFFE